MPQKEASARIKINMLLEAAGWRVFDDLNRPANISLQSNLKGSRTVPYRTAHSQEVLRQTAFETTF